MSKRLRHQRIVELVSQGRVHSQEDLRDLLSKEGFDVTQSTLSRDIKELALVKGPDGYRTPVEPSEAMARTPPLEQALDQYLLKATVAMNLVVLRTAPANAQPLANALDHHALPEILGTVAGDDTVLIVTASELDARSLHDRILSLARD
ncbi:MAG: hypothetical protein AB1486_26455 [Planctomycetota bacterium]